MEELREIAKKNYESSSPKVKELAQYFFQLVDKDGDGKVDYSEFFTFMTAQGYKGFASFFFKLDEDKNGGLDFFEVVTLYYMFISETMPFCGACNVFVPERFWPCTNAYCPKKNLCSTCYESKNRCCKSGRSSPESSSDNGAARATRDLDKDKKWEKRIRNAKRVQTAVEFTGDVLDAVDIMMSCTIM